MRQTASETSSVLERWAASWRLAVCAVLAVGLLADLTWLLNSAVVPWDSKNHFYPMFRFLGDQFANQGFPLWNPYHFAGHPSAADPQSLVFSPTMLLLAFFAPTASMQVFDAAIMAHLTFGGLGLLALFHRRGWQPPGAVLAAVIYMLGASASARLQHTGMILSYSFFPWALWSLETALERRSYGYGALFGLMAALMAQGRDQVAFLFCLWLLAAYLYEAYQAPNRWNFLRQRLGLTLFMGLTGAALLFVPILLTMQFLGQSNRPQIAYGVAAEGSLAIVNFVTLAVPNFFGSLDWNYDYWGPGYETMPQGDWTDRAINFLFIGTLPTVLLVWHGMFGRRLLEKPIRLFSLILIFTFFYAIGRFSPVFELIFDHLPGVSLYRRPADATFALQFALAVLSGYLANQALSRELPALSDNFRRVIWLGLAAGIVTATLVMAVVFSAQQGHLQQSLLASIPAFVLAGGYILLSFRKIPTATLVVALVGVTCAELILRDGASSLNSEPAKVYAPYAGLTPEFQAGLDLLQKEIAKAHDEGRYPRVEIQGMPGPWMNASMVFRLENTVGYNPLRIADYERTVGPGDNSGDVSLRHFPANFRGYSSTLAKLLGLDYVMLNKPLSKLPRHFPRPIATLIYSTEGMYIYKLRPSTPRAYIASAIKPVDNEAIMDGDAIPDFDRTRDVLMDETASELLAPRLNPANPMQVSNISITSMRANTSEIDVETDQPGILVLHDIDYPGWRASIDGQTTPIYRANILFRAIYVPAGKHHIRFEYQPFAPANLISAMQSLLKPKDTN